MTKATLAARDRRGRSLNRRFVALVAAATAVPSAMGQGATALAADGNAERAARSHFHQGELHYQAGHYPEALEAYQAGYEVQPLPGFLVNIAQCQRRMGDLERARATYGKFMLVAPDSPLVPEVRGLIEELDRLIEETNTARALPSASGQVATSAPRGLAAVERVTATASSISPPSAVEPGAPSGVTPAGVDLAAGPTTSTPDLAGETSSGRRYHRWWLWGSAAVVAAGLATLAVVISSPGAHTVYDGSLGSLRR